VSLTRASLKTAAIGMAEEISALKLQWALCHYYYYYYYSSSGSGDGSSSNSSKGTVHPRTVHEGPEMEWR